MAPRPCHAFETGLGQFPDLKVFTLKSSTAVLCPITATIDFDLEPQSEKPFELGSR